MARNVYVIAMLQTHETYKPQQSLGIIIQIHSQVEQQHGNTRNNTTFILSGLIMPSLCYPF